MNKQLKENNYIFLPKFIDPYRASLLSTEFKKYTKSNLLGGDNQAPNSRAMHNFLPFVRLMIEKVGVLSDFVGEDLLPTYTYARVYHKGSVLERHTDRPACEISFTMNLDKDKNWPIYIQKPDGTESKIEMNPGDAMLYLGCIADHWRLKYTGNEYTQVFIHYVRSFGENSWAFFDIKKSEDNIIYEDEISYSVI